MALLANFTVNGATNPARHVAVYGSTVSLAIVSASGFDSVEFSIVAPSMSNQALPTLSPAGTPVGSVSSFAMPSDPGDGLGRSFLIKCTGTKHGKATESFGVVGALNTNGVLPIAAGEELVRDSAYGYIDELNQALAPSTTSGSTPTLATVLGAGASAGNRTITDVSDPVNDQDVATKVSSKLYADSVGAAAELAANVSANLYTDSVGAAVESAANAYTDASVSGLGASPVVGHVPPEAYVSVRFDGVTYSVTESDLNGHARAVAAGLSVLRGAVGWWDIMHTSAEYVDATFDADMSTWAGWGRSITGSIADPEGGTGAQRLASTVTGSVYTRCSSPDSYGGYSIFTGRIKVHEANAAAAGSMLLSTSQYYGACSGTLTLRAPSEESASKDDLPVVLVSDMRAVGWKWVEDDDDSDWRDFAIGSMLTDINGSAYVTGVAELRFTAESVGDVADFYQLEYSQRRVTSVAARVGTTPLTQSTNTRRPTIVPEGWMGRDCIIGAENADVGLTAAVSVGAGPLLAIGTVCPMRVQRYVNGDPDPVFALLGATSTISLTCIQAAAGNLYHGEWGWTVTNDAGVTSSGVFGGYLPSVPVAVALELTAENTLILYVDGEAVGSPASVSGDFTITSFETMGRESWCMCTSWAVLRGIYPASDIRHASIAMRSEALLPTKWKLIHYSGQSNSTHGSSVCMSAMQETRFATGSSVRIIEGSGVVGEAKTIVPWTPSPTCRSWAADSVLTNYFGPAHTFAAEAAKNSDYGYCVISTGLGGAGIDNWLGLGTVDLYTKTRAAWDTAVQTLGTHLHARYASIWIQGEADATYGTVYPGGYYAALGAIFTQDVADFGGAYTNIIHKLNVNFVSGTESSRQAVWDAQDAYDTAHEYSYQSSIDYGVTHYDGVHYDALGRGVLGRNIYRAMAGLTQIAP